MTLKEQCDFIYGEFTKVTGAPATAEGLHQGQAFLDVLSSLRELERLRAKWNEYIEEQDTKEALELL
jgi:hypothetical protein